MMQQAFDKQRHEPFFPIRSGPLHGLECDDIITLDDIIKNYREDKDNYHNSFQNKSNGYNNNSTEFLATHMDDKTTATIVHQYFMERALEEARLSARNGEVPVGALVVQNVTSQTTNWQQTVQLMKDKQSQHHQGNMSSNFKTKVFVTNDTIEDTTQPATTFFVIISRAGNRVEAEHDASAHAELLAMQQAAKLQKNWRLYQTTLYTTLEPCTMCCAAAQAFRVDQIVYGAPDVRLGATGGRRQQQHNNDDNDTTFNLLSIAPHPFHTISNVVGGVLEDECAYELKSFFQQRRKQRRDSSQKKKKNKERISIQQNSHYKGIEQKNSNSCTILVNSSKIQPHRGRWRWRFMTFVKRWIFQPIGGFWS